MFLITFPAITPRILSSKPLDITAGVLLLVLPAADMVPQLYGVPSSATYTQPCAPRKVTLSPVPACCCTRCTSCAQQARE